MIEFEPLWQFIFKRRPALVQERTELEHVYNLIQGCESYLEVGTAEGDSLYVLAHALKRLARITSIDLGENHTKPYQAEIMKLLAPDYIVAMYHGDSRHLYTYPRKLRHDVVMIDGGHDFNTVLSDALVYGALADKFILFHDVKMPEVKQAVDYFVSHIRCQNYYEVINSDDKGYGIVVL